MQLYLDIDSVPTGKIRVTVRVEIEGIKTAIRKHLFLREGLTPFTYNVINNFLTIYAEAVGEITIDQTSTIEGSYIILKVNGDEVGDNNDVYNKLEAL